MAKPFLLFVLLFISGIASAQTILQPGGDVNL